MRTIIKVDNIFFLGNNAIELKYINKVMKMLT